MASAAPSRGELAGSLAQALRRRIEERRGRFTGATVIHGRERFEGEADDADARGVGDGVQPSAGASAGASLDAASPSPSFDLRPRPAFASVPMP